MSIFFEDLFLKFKKTEVKFGFSEYKYRQILNECKEEIFLEEGRGMVAKKKGEEFINKKTGAKKFFSQAVLFPPQGGAYKNTEEIFLSIRNFLKLKSSTGPIKNGENTPQMVIEKVVNVASKSAILVVLTDEESKKFGYLKYFNSITSGGIGKWPESHFAKDTGYAKQTGASVLEKMPLQPILIVGDFVARDVIQLKHHVMSNIKKIVSNGELPDFVLKHIDMLFSAALSHKSSPVLEGALPYQSAYEKYLGELFAPVSVLQNWLISGQYEESEKILVKSKGGSYVEMKVRFPQTISNALTDSELIMGSETNPSITVGISSKAGSGAAASAVSLYKILQKNVFTPIFKKKYAKVISLIEKITVSNSVLGPLEIAIELGLINPAEAKYVLNLFSGTLSNLTLPQYLVGIKEGIIKKPSANLMKLSALFGGNSPLELAKKKDLLMGYRPGYHYLAGVAKQISLITQKDSLFNEGLKEILSKSSLIQVYSHSKKTGQNGIQFQNFVVKYPPTFNGRIIIDASKNYFASAPPKGKLSFKLK